MYQCFWVAGRLPGSNDIIRKHYRVYSTLKKAADLTVWAYIKNAKIQPMQAAHVSFRWCEQATTAQNERDPDNIMFGQKFVFDALVKAKILPNDRRKNVLSVKHTFCWSASEQGVEVTLES